MPSNKCFRGKYWDSSTSLCERCETKYPLKKGLEFTENCGWSDHQYEDGPTYQKCSQGTFNDGSQPFCRTCSSCQTTVFISCNSTSDTVCCSQGEQISGGKCVPRPQTSTITTPRTTESRTFPITSSVVSSPTITTPRTTESTTIPITSTVASSSPHSTTSPSTTNPKPHTDLTGIYVCLGILSALSLLCLFLVIRRRKNKPWNKELGKNSLIRESLSKKSIDRFQQSVSYNIIKENGHNDNVTGSSHLIAPEVQNAPLKTVLNNLDVLEELVQVLDPDISGAKNTRHLAAQCSFSFAWINYAYSMKDRKSPLVAVLEGVVTKNPDWNVSHFAQMLSSIGRNDAVEILAKLPAGAEE